jgi:hypothetical protein
VHPNILVIVRDNTTWRLRALILYYETGRNFFRKNCAMSLTNIGRWISIVDGVQSLTQQVNYNQCQQVEPLPSSSGPPCFLVAAPVRMSRSVLKPPDHSLYLILSLSLSPSSSHYAPHQRKVSPRPTPNVAGLTSPLACLPPISCPPTPITTWPDLMPRLWRT